jgi:hypothetical protein
MTGYFYFINDKYKKVFHNDNKKEMELKEIKIISEENEVLLDKKNDFTDVSNVSGRARAIYKKLLNYIF